MIYFVRLLASRGWKPDLLTGGHRLVALDGFVDGQGGGGATGDCGKSGPSVDLARARGRPPLRLSRPPATQNQVRLFHFLFFPVFSIIFDLGPGISCPGARTTICSSLSSLPVPPPQPSSNDPDFGRRAGGSVNPYINKADINFVNEHGNRPSVRWN